MDKQAVLNLSKAEALEGNKFKIQIGDQEYIYQVPEDKEVELVVDKINNWVNKGVDQWGGLYDYINRNFKLLTTTEESQELVEESLLDKYKLNGDDKFRYMMLSRLQSDCKYVLGAGEGDFRHLWVNDDPETHCALMRELYDSLEEKPDWITPEDIDTYEKKMKGLDINESEELKEGFLDDEEDESNKITVEEHDGTVTISIDTYSADFEPKSKDKLETFKVEAQDIVKDDMTPEDYAKLLACILSNLDPTDYKKFTDFMSAFNGASVEEEIEDETGVDVPEEPSEDIPAEDVPAEETPAEDIPAENESEELKEDEESEDGTEPEESVDGGISNTNSEEPESEQKQLDLQIFIDLAKELGLSLFEFSKRGEHDNDFKYLIGRVSPDNGELQYITYGEDESGEELLPVPDTWDQICEVPQLLNNTENREKYIDYLNKVAKTIIELDNKVTLEDVEKGE